MCLLSDKSAATHRLMLQVIIEKCTEVGLQWLQNLVLLHKLGFIMDYRDPESRVGYWL